MISIIFLLTSSFRDYVSTSRKLQMYIRLDEIKLSCEKDEDDFKLNTIQLRSRIVSECYSGIIENV